MAKVARIRPRHEEAIRLGEAILKFCTALVDNASYPNIPATGHHKRAPVGMVKLPLANTSLRRFEKQAFG